MSIPIPFGFRRPALSRARLERLPREGLSIRRDQLPLWRDRDSRIEDPLARPLVDRARDQPEP